MTLGSHRLTPTVRGTRSSSVWHSRACPRSKKPSPLRVDGCSTWAAAAAGRASPLARAYRSATVLGVDIDQRSVDLDMTNTRDAGVKRASALTVRRRRVPAEGTVDVAYAFECVHEMHRPVEVLSAVCRTLARGGSLVVMDEAVADAFDPDGDDLERIMYGFSLFVCLPDGLSSPPSVGTGTVMRPSTLAGLRRGRRFGQGRAPSVDRSCRGGCTRTVQADRCRLVSGAWRCWRGCRRVLRRCRSTLR